MKLKRILISVLSLLMLTSVALFASCKSDQDATLVEISYLSGMPGSVWVNKTPDYSSLKINAVYDDETSKEIVYDAESFTVTVDTSEVDSFAEVVITYGGKECKTTISVIEYEIAGVELPEFAAKYNGATDEDSSSMFKDKKQDYVVGNVNPFYFSPIVTGYDENNNEIREELVAINADVYSYQNDEEVAIDNPSDYYTLNNETAAFSFTSAAKDKIFLIRVYPQSLTEAQLEDKDVYSVDFIFTVKDKYYNVYNAVDLLVFDNRKEVNSTESDGTAMYNFRAKKGLDNDAITGLDGIALHNNISLSDSDFPEEYFWQESELAGLSDEQKTKIKGSLKDETFMLYRDLGQNGKFAVDGNYFTINASAISKITIEKIRDPNKSTAEVVAHSKLFYVFGQSNRDETNYTEEAAFNNLSLIGNLNRSESEYSGGLIFMEAKGAKTHIYNNIANSWYITTFSSRNSTGHGVTVEKSIYEDDYNSIFYVWGGILDVKESIVRRAGGPVVIADHVENKSDQIKKAGRVGGKGGWPAVLNFDAYTSANMYSYVTGQEGWFAQMKANNIAETLKGELLAGVNLMSSNIGYSYTNSVTENGTTKTLMNLIAIFKDSGSENFDELCKYTFIGKANFGTHVFDYEDVAVKSALEDTIIKSNGIPLIYSKSSETITGLGAAGESVLYFALKNSKMEQVTDPRKLPIITNYAQGEGFGTFLNVLYRPTIQNEGVRPGALGLVFGDFSNSEN